MLLGKTVILHTEDDVCMFCIKTGFVVEGDVKGESEYSNRFF